MINVNNAGFLIWFVSMCIYTVLILALMIIQIIFAKKGLSLYANKNDTSKDFKKSTKQINYCKKLLEFINELIIDSSNSEFKLFIANRDTEKLSKADMTKLIEKIVENIMKGIRFDNIVFDDIMITKEYLSEYIIKNTVYAVNRLLDEYLQQDKN